MVKGEDRDAFLADDRPGRAGQRPGHPRREPVGREGRRPRSVWPTRSPPPAAPSAGSSHRGEGALAGWIEAEARDRGLVLGPGAAKELAERIGGFVREGDAERATRPASRPWSSTSSPLSRNGRRSTPTTSGRSSPRRSRVGLGVHRCRRRAPRRSGAWAARPAARSDPRAGPARGPPPAHPRAPRDRRPAADRRAAAGRRQGDGHRQRVPGGEAGDQAKRWTTPSSSPRSTASSSSMRWSRARRVPVGRGTATPGIQSVGGSRPRAVADAGRLQTERR